MYYMHGSNFDLENEDQVRYDLVENSRTNLLSQYVFTHKKKKWRFLFQSFVCGTFREGHAYGRTGRHTDDGRPRYLLG